MSGYRHGVCVSALLRAAPTLVNLCVHHDLDLGNGGANHVDPFLMNGGRIFAAGWSCWRSKCRPLSKRSIETLVDLVEIKLSCLDVFDREDAREKSLP